MAKTKGQLFSLAARGSIGGILTYQGQKGHRQTHIKATPSNPQTSEQNTDRQKWTDVVAFWHTLTDTEKAEYNELGPQYGNITGFNVWIKLNKQLSLNWIKFGNAKFGENAKFGGPLGSQIT